MSYSLNYPNPSNSDPSRVGPPDPFRDIRQANNPFNAPVPDTKFNDPTTDTKLTKDHFAGDNPRWLSKVIGPDLFLGWDSKGDDVHQVASLDDANALINSRIETP